MTIQAMDGAAVVGDHILHSGADRRFGIDITDDVMAGRAKAEMRSQDIGPILY